MQCFVIMPFGEKVGQDGRPINFDHVFEKLIQPAIEQAALTPVRGDRYHGSGGIMATMMDMLANAPVALVDATVYNPNAFYELGIRHSFRRRLTVAIKADGYMPPYDVRDVPFFSYKLVDQKVAEPEKTAEALAEHIRRCLQATDIDSPVLANLPEGRPPSPMGKSLKSGARILYASSQLDGLRIGLRAGDLRDVHDVDVWVNSENDRMQLARVLERSISSTIRYLGARIDAGGDVTRDHVAENLEKAVRTAKKSRPGEQPRVALGSVFMTAPGRLADTHNVKRIFHVATVTGDYMRGFSPGSDIAGYSEKVVMAVDAFNRDKKNARESKLESMLIPMFGTGQGGGTVETVSDQLVSGALAAVAKIATKNQPTRLNTIEFLAFGARALYALESSFGKHAALGHLSGRDGPPAGALG